MNDKSCFPEDPILLIDFIRPKEFYSLLFDDTEYQVIGHDDVDNFIAIAEDYTVHYLDTESGAAFYIAPSVKIFIQELELYKRYAKEYPLTQFPSAIELAEYASGFMEKIRNLDCNAFNNESTFWSVIVEQMETEQL